MTGKQTQIYDDYFSRLYVYAHHYIEIGGYANKVVKSECAVYCFNELFADPKFYHLAEKSLEYLSNYLYNKARKFCSNYLKDTYGSDSFTDEDHIKLIKDTERIHFLYMKGYRPWNFKKHKDLPNDTSAN